MSSVPSAELTDAEWLDLTRRYADRFPPLTSAEVAACEKRAALHARRVLLPALERVPVSRRLDVMEDGPTRDALLASPAYAAFSQRMAAAHLLLSTRLAAGAAPGDAFQRALWLTAARPPWPALTVSSSAAVQPPQLLAFSELWESVTSASLVVVYALPPRHAILALAWQTLHVHVADAVALLILVQLDTAAALDVADECFLRDQLDASDQSNAAPAVKWLLRTPLRYVNCAFGDTALLYPHGHTS